MKKRIYILILLLNFASMFWVSCTQDAAVDASKRQETMDKMVTLTLENIIKTKVPLVEREFVSPQNTSQPTLMTLNDNDTSLPTKFVTATLDNRLTPKYWSEWPIIPTLNDRAIEIYRGGIVSGNNEEVFSVIGDCQSEPNVFLGIYATDRYYLGEGYKYLEETIAYYQDSFQITSQGVRDGLSAPSALSPTWADPAYCKRGENPVECELRIHRPSIVFVNLGTNWKPGASALKYEEYLRSIVEIIIKNGTLPILSTKADNVEGDHSLNRATAQVAYDYDIPLWNFWLAAQSLPNNGLDGERDNIYLTPDGWNRRNFTALQVLDSVWRSVVDH